jgi:diguanylate cyclase (GGDEF)-like protein/PAS domain S-box-containing protein
VTTTKGHRGASARSASDTHPSDAEWACQALEAMGRGVMVMDEHGGIVLSNPAAQAMHQLSAADLHGRTSFDPRWHAVDRDGNPVTGDDFPAVRCLRRGEPVLGEVLGVRTGSGELQWHRIDARPLRRDGRTTGVVVVFEDITETMNIRAELDRSEQRLTEARRAGRVALWEWNAATGEVWHDEHFELVTGQAFSEGPTGWLGRVHPDDRDLLGRAHDRLLRGEPAEMTYRVLDPSGDERWRTCRAHVVSTDDEGRIQQVAGSVVDITDTMTTTTELRTLLDSMGDGYYTLDQDWRFAFVNGDAVEMLRRRDLIGRNVWDEFPGLEDLLRPQYELAVSGTAVDFEVYYGWLDAWYEVRARPLGSGVAVCFRDVTERHRATEERERLLAEAAEAHARLAFAAAHDELTGLPNRTALMRWLRARVTTTSDDPPVALLYLDLDRFKLVNDTYGHTSGDALLVQAAQRLSAAVRPADLVARLGGDEFVVGVPGAAPDELDAIATRIVHAFREPFTVSARRLVVSTSVGVARAGASSTPESLVRDADAALYRAKDAGRDQVAWFDQSLRESAWRRLATEADLREALQPPAMTIQPYYQPVYDLRSGDIVATEALARWAHPERGLLSPASFIPVAEETGLIVDLGWVMLDAAGAALPSLSPTFTPRAGRVWVNVAARQLDEPGFVDDLLRWAEDRAVNGRVGLEITESALTRDLTSAQAALHRLADHGFAIAIDDFGTGFSSLSRLAQFPVDVIKIDQSFVADLDTDAGRGIVMSVVSLAHSLGATACAEGVEHDRQLQVLTDLGVDLVSGYHLCPPVALSRFGTAAPAGTDRIRTIRTGHPRERTPA